MNLWLDLHRLSHTSLVNSNFNSKYLVFLVPIEPYFGPYVDFCISFCIPFYPVGFILLIPLQPLSPYQTPVSPHGLIGPLLDLLNPFLTNLFYEYALDQCAFFLYITMEKDQQQHPIQYLKEEFCSFWPQALLQGQFLHAGKMHTNFQISEFSDPASKREKSENSFAKNHYSDLVHTLVRRLLPCMLLCVCKAKLSKLIYQQGIRALKANLASQRGLIFCCTHFYINLEGTSLISKTLHLILQKISNNHLLSKLQTVATCSLRYNFLQMNLIQEFCLFYPQH